MKSIEMHLNEFWRRRLRQTFGEEASRLQKATGLPHISDAAADRLWQKIETRLPHSAAARGKSPFGLAARLHRTRAAKALEFCRNPLAFACIALSALTIAYLKKPDSLDLASLVAKRAPTYGEFKGEKTVPAVRLSSLRFAIVARDGALTPGHERMELNTDDMLVFSVEASGVAAASGQPVTLSYALVPERLPQVIAEYVLRSDQEILQGNHGYIAFKPTRPGLYEFTLRLGTASTNRVDDAVGFTIKVSQP